MGDEDEFFCQKTKGKYVKYNMTYVGEKVQAAQMVSPLPPTKDAKKWAIYNWVL